MKNILLPIAIISLFISSCCTKKYCEPEQYPRITITLEGFNSSQTGYVIVTHQFTGTVIDSFEFDHNTIIISQNQQGYSPIEHFYQIYSDSNRVDLLSRITYDMKSETIECNTCFLTKDIQDITSFRNLSFFLNNSHRQSQAVSLYPN